MTSPRSSRAIRLWKWIASISSAMIPVCYWKVATDPQYLQYVGVVMYLFFVAGYAAAAAILNPILFLSARWVSAKDNHPFGRRVLSGMSVLACVATIGVISFLPLYPYIVDPVLPTNYGSRFHYWNALASGTWIVSALAIAALSLHPLVAEAREQPLPPESERQQSLVPAIVVSALVVAMALLPVLFPTKVMTPTPSVPTQPTP